MAAVAAASTWAKIAAAAKTAAKVGGAIRSVEGNSDSRENAPTKAKTASNNARQRAASTGYNSETY